MVNDTKAHQRAQQAQWLLQLGVVVAAVGLWSSWQQLQLIQDLARGANIPDAVVEASDARQQLIGFGQLGVGLVSAVVFLMWTSAITKRLTQLGVIDMRYAPRWSVWGFIIPIVNLFRPYQVMSELWKASLLVRVSEPAAVRLAELVLVARQDLIHAADPSRDVSETTRNLN